MSNIDISQIDLKTLPWMPLTSAAGFPKEPVVYFAMDDSGKVCYVGKSVNPRERWRQHHRKEALIEIGATRVAFLFVGEIESLIPVEQAAIRHFQPECNVVGVDTAEPVPTKRLKNGDRSRKAGKPIAVSVSSRCYEDFKRVANAQGMSLGEYARFVIQKHYESEAFDSMLGRARGYELQQLAKTIPPDRHDEVIITLKELLDEDELFVMGYYD